MSEYDAIRKRKQGSGQSEYSSIRNRVVAPKPTTQQLIDSKVLPPADFRKSSVLQTPVVKSTPYQPPGRFKTDLPGGVVNPVNLVNRFRNSKVGTAVDAFTQGVGSGIGLAPEQMGPKANTGSELENKILGGAGQLTSYFVNPGAMSQGPLALYRAAGNLKNTKLIDAAMKFLPNEGVTLNRAGTGVTETLANKALQEGAKELAVGAAYGAPSALIQGKTSGEDIAKNVALEGGIGAVAGAASPLVGAGLKAVAGKLGSLKRTPRSVATSPTAPRPVENPVMEPTVFPVSPAKPQPIKARRVEKPPEVPKEPTVLDDLVTSRGYEAVTPETIAQTYNTKNWYHGTGTNKLTKDSLDPFAGSHESLFGQGVYLTDSPEIAEGYAKTRGRRSKTPTVYESNVNMNKVLDLEKPITPDVSEAIQKVADSFDYHDDGHISSLIREEIAKPGATPEGVIQKLRSEVSDFSHREMIPSSDFVENFQDLAINLKKAGYDGLTHTGGLRTGKDPHRVLIMLDPQDAYGAGNKQVSRLDKYTPPVQPKRRPVSPTMLSTARAAQEKAPPVGTGSPIQEPSSLLEDAAGAIRSAGQAAKETVQEIGGILTGDKNLGISPFKKTDPYVNLKNDTKSQIVSRSKRERAPAGQRTVDIYSDLVDDVYRLKEADRIAELKKDGDLLPTESSYQLALASRYSDQIAKQILTDKLVDSAGNVIGGSLKDALSKLEPGKMVDFEDYLLNRHAITRMEDRGEKVFADDLNWTPDYGRSKVSSYEAANPAFKEMADQVYDFQKNMVQKWLVDTGMITQKKADAWFEANPYYVPNKRYFTELEKRKGGRGLTKRGYVGQSVPVKAYGEGGSQRKVISPIESMIENVDSFVKAAKRNQSMQALVANVKQHPDDYRDLVEIVERPEKFDLDAIDLTSGSGIDEVLSRLDEDFSQAMQATRKDRDNVIHVLVDGKPVHLKFNDKGLLNAVTAMGPDQVGKVFGAIGKVTNFMKTLTTGANPIFVFTRSLLRDIPQAYIASKSTNNPLQFGADLLEAAWSIMTNRELYKDFKRMGGGHTASVAADRNLLAQSKRKILPAKGGRVAGVVPKTFDLLQNILNATESATRLGEFKRLAKDKDADGRLAGIFESQEVATNFKRRGRLTRELDALFPYFNAAVQGLDKFARTYKDNPVQATVKSFMAITIPTLVAYAFNYDNPDYQKLSNAVKDNYIMIPRGDGTFFKVAKPKEIGTIFSDVPERLMRQFLQQDPDAFRKFAGQLRETFTLPGVNGALQGFERDGITGALSGAVSDTIVGPAVGAAANQNWAGSPIVPGYLERNSPELQFDSKTSAPAKIAGKLTGTSPMKLDYVMKQYLGGVGQFGLPATSAGGNTADALTKQVTTDPVFSNDIMDKFYSAKEKLDRAKADANVTGKIPPGYNDGQRKLYERVSDNIGALRTRSRAIEEDPNIPAASKRDQLRSIRDQMNQLAQQTISTSPIKR